TVARKQFELQVAPDYGVVALLHRAHRAFANELVELELTDSSELFRLGHVECPSDPPNVRTPPAESNGERKVSAGPSHRCVPTGPAWHRPPPRRDAGALDRRSSGTLLWSSARRPPPPPRPPPSPPPPPPRTGGLRSGGGARSTRWQRAPRSVSGAARFAP